MAKHHGFKPHRGKGGGFGKVARAVKSTGMAPNLGHEMTAEQERSDRLSRRPQPAAMAPPGPAPADGGGDDMGGLGTMPGMDV